MLDPTIRISPCSGPSGKQRKRERGHHSLILEGIKGGEEAFCLPRQRKAGGEGKGAVTSSAPYSSALYLCGGREPQHRLDLRLKSRLLDEDLDEGSRSSANTIGKGMT